MNKLAMYEQGEGKKYLPVSRYYRSDYIGRNVFRNASINGLLAIGMTFVVLTGGIDFLLVQSWDVQVCILHILHSLSKDIQRSWQF